MQRLRKSKRILIIAAIVVAMLLGAFVPLAQRAQRFEWIVVKKLTVQNDASFLGDITQSGDFAPTGDVTLTGDLTVTGDTDLTGALDLTGAMTQDDGDAVIADDLRITAQTALTVTNGSAFTATGTYQGIIAASEVTPTITAGTAGDVLILTNTGTNTINIADTGTQMLSAAWAAGQYDTLTLFSDGTNWLELSRSDN